MVMHERGREVHWLNGSSRCCAADEGQRSALWRSTGPAFMDRAAQPAPASPSPGDRRVHLSLASR